MPIFNRFLSARAWRAVAVAGAVALLALPGCNHRRQALRPIMFGPSYSSSSSCTSCGAATVTGTSTCSSCGGGSSAIGTSTYSSGSSGTGSSVSSTFSDDISAPPADELAPINKSSGANSKEEPGIDLKPNGSASFRSDARTPTAFNNEDRPQGWSARRIAFP